MAKFKPEIWHPRRSAWRSLARSHSARSRAHANIVAWLRSVSMKDASENLQDRNSQLCSCSPDKSAKLKLHLSKAALVNVDRLESAFVKVEAWHCAPRKLNS